MPLSCVFVTFVFVFGFGVDSLFGSHLIDIDFVCGEHEHQRSQVWVALEGAVYDVTRFLDAHPGGAERIQMVNGQVRG